MSQSVDSSMLRENLNLERHGQLGGLGGTPSHTARPRTLFYSKRRVFDDNDDDCDDDDDERNGPRLIQRGPEHFST